MPHADSLFFYIGMYVALMPLVLFAVLAITGLLGRSMSERVTGSLVPTAVISSLLAATAMLAMMLLRDTRHVTINFGHWVAVPEYHFSVRLIFDRLSIPFVILSLLLCGTIGAFANRYLHRESGYHRFFLLYTLFCGGMVLTSLAGTVETLFAGWELVGLSSALLVSFFHERTGPVHNSLHVWTVYRISDAALLLAAVALHHATGDGDFDHVLGAAPWPEAHSILSSGDALLIGGLMLVAAAGKSALVPFSGWLPRAMEGPTPSSAVFYGALSVHLGAYLLLRISPLLDLSTMLSLMVFGAGLATAVFAAFAGSAQTDIKSSLSFASLVQVGLIVAEIGLGFRYLPLMHIIGHGCYRTLQFLRAPTLLLDRSQLESALGGRLPDGPLGFRRYLSPAWERRFYRWALERGFLDAVLREYLVEPVLRVLRACDRWEKKFTDLLAGPAPPASSSNLLDDLP